MGASVLQSCARITIGPRRRNSYFACGFTGYIVGLVLVMVLSVRAELGIAARLAIAIAPPATFLILLRLTMAVFGRERIVYYEFALTAIAISSLLAWAAGAPFAVALDITTIGIGVFLAFGRIGCLRVGCCHGRPSRHGIRYGRDHVSAGFEARLQDVPVLPVQLLDGAASAALTIAGLVAMHAGAPGDGAALYASGYAVSRFGLELLRGDDRPYGLGLSEAQWTALATGALAAALAPSAFTLSCAVALAVAAAALVVAWRVRWPLAFWLANPRHLRELDSLLIAQCRSSRRTAAHTTEGLRISVHAMADDSFDVVASHPHHRVTPAVLRRVGERLGANWQLVDAIAGRNPGLVHLLLRNGR